MSKLHLILGDQLSTSISSLKAFDVQKDTILMCEVWEEATHVKHHKKKIAFLFSAMRHFSETLQKKGYKVHYTVFNAKHNTGSFTGEVARHLQTGHYEAVVVTEPSEYRVLKMVQSWQSSFKLPVHICPDDRFLCNHETFAHWAQSRKQLRMEFFYREMRKAYGILMCGDQPIGGKWNFDSENRKPPKEGLEVPKPMKFKSDDITLQVIKLVKKEFTDHFGQVDHFHFAVTRQQAVKVLKHFITHRLPQFGDYQDAMVADEPWMFHAHIGLYLNCGLLLPLECIEAAVEAYQQKLAPLNAVEGFIRQILGWREFVRGLYWLKMPQYSKENYFEAKHRLPALYWNAETSMNCLHQCVQATQEHAYAHHIQRLMVLGNFALLIGVDPKEVNNWFWVVYADAYEWVELPNVTGMALFADGGLLASKPYASSGSYIHKMSNYCESCHYKVQQKQGERACPFNYLYWNFLASNRKKLKNNPRMSMMYGTYDRMKPEAKKQIQQQSEHFIKMIHQAT